MLAVAKLMELASLTRPDDYREAVTPWLQRYSGTQNFGWSPRVTEEQREQFEAEQRAAGRPDFRILGRDAQGKTFPALPAAGAGIADACGSSPHGTGAWPVADGAFPALPQRRGRQ